MTLIIQQYSIHHSRADYAYALGYKETLIMNNNKTFGLYCSLKEDTFVGCNLEFFNFTVPSQAHNQFSISSWTRHSLSKVITLIWLFWHFIRIFVLYYLLYQMRIYGAEWKCKKKQSHLAATSKTWKNKMSDRRDAELKCLVSPYTVL